VLSATRNASSRRRAASAELYSSFSDLALPMKKPAHTPVKPVDIFMQAEGVLQACGILSEDRVKDNPHLAGSVGYSIIILSAFASELYFKCLICMETGKVPHGHHLKHLFDKQSSATQTKIEKLWNDLVVPMRDSYWTQVETAVAGKKIPRDLRGALTTGNQAFEKVRYIYEGSAGITFFLGDLPNILRHIILEIKPEWGRLRRRYQELPTSPNH
jgi:hypothetical protein